MVENSDQENLSIAPQLAQLITNVLDEYGIAPDDLLFGTGLSQCDLSTSEQTISIQQMLAIINRAMSLSDMPDLGLVIGCRETIGTWGILGYAIMSSPTEKFATELASKYERATASLLRTIQFEENDQLRVQFSSLVPLGKTLRFCIEESLAGIATVYPQFLGRAMRFHKIALSYSDPGYKSRYEELFDCPVLFEQPYNQMWVDMPRDCPMRTADPTSSRFAIRLVEEVLARYEGGEDLVERVRRFLLSNPGTFPDIEEVSAGFSMSSRSLRRKLRERGTSFREILDELRMDLALDYLENSKLTIEQIASLVGYTETTNFRRAFKRLKQNPPTFYRRKD